MSHRYDDTPDHRPGFWLPNTNTAAATRLERRTESIGPYPFRNGIASIREGPPMPQGPVIMWAALPGEYQLTMVQARYLVHQGWGENLLDRLQHPEEYCPAVVHANWPDGPFGRLYAPCSVPANGKLCTSHRRRLEGLSTSKVGLKPGQWDKEMQQAIYLLAQDNYAERAEAYMAAVLRMLTETLAERTAEIVWL